MIECSLCYGEMRDFGPSRRSRATGGRTRVFMCEECGAERDITPPDYVVLAHPNTILCQMCGRSYKWNMPCPIPVFTAGSLAFGYEHLGCEEYRNEWRAKLLGFLLTGKGAPS